MQFRPHRCAVPAALALTVALAGCSDDWANRANWFQKPLDVLGNKGGYTFSELQEAKLRQHPITANDFVNANGSCPPPAAPAPAVAPPPAAPGQPASTPAQPVAADPASLLGSDIALGMSECDVVYRAGAPSSVQIGKNRSGTRTAVLTFDTGPRAGVYRFEAGELKEMNSVPAAAAPPATAKKKAPKSAKAGKTARPPKGNDT